jgi:hypothetical protein
LTIDDFHLFLLKIMCASQGEDKTAAAEAGEKADPFFAAIAALSANKDDPISEWVYAGGDGGAHAAWFKLRYPGREPPGHRASCICGHPIAENCFIENRLTRALIVVGNCCIRRYLPKNQAGRSCADCGRPHRNRRDAWCDSCRGGTLRCGKHMGESFRAVLESDGEYCDWAQDTVDVNSSSSLASFAAWLEQRRGARQKKQAALLTAGKHKGEAFEEVFAKDRDYCLWVQWQTHNDTLADFRQWLWRRYWEDVPQQGPNQSSPPTPAPAGSAT